MRLSIIGTPFDNPPVFGLSRFLCHDENGSTVNLVLCGSQYYVCGFDWVDFNHPATPVYSMEPRNLRLVGFEI